MVKYKFKRVNKSIKNVARRMVIVFNNYDDILTVEQLMEALYIGKNTAYKLLNSGEILSFKIGKVYKIPRKALEDYIAKRCEG